jgi:hypothetical protein
MIDWISEPSGAFSLVAAQVAKTVFLNLFEDKPSNVVESLLSSCINSKNLGERVSVFRIIKLFIMKVNQN